MTDEDMRGSVCLITGATSGIGQATANELARLGATVVLVARDRAGGERVAAEIRHQVPAATVDSLSADLSSLTEVRQLAERVLARHDRLDVLINNAAVASFQRRTTALGLELDFATNYLGPFLLTNLLLDRLKASAPARVINVASDTHKSVKAIPWDDLQGERTYDPRAAYNLSKLLDILFTYALAARLGGSGVTANCLHPGWPIRTNLDREARGLFGLVSKVSKRFAVSAEQGASTSIYLATSPEVWGISGGYFTSCRAVTSSALSRDDAAAERLWRLSEHLCTLAGQPLSVQPEPSGGSA